MAIVERFTAAEARLRAPPPRTHHYDLLFDNADRFGVGTPGIELRAKTHSSTTSHRPKPQCRFRRPSVSPAPDSQISRSYPKPITSAVRTAHFKLLYRKRSGPELAHTQVWEGYAARLFISFRELTPSPHFLPSGRC